MWGSFSNIGVELSSTHAVLTVVVRYDLGFNALPVLIISRQFSNDNTEEKLCYVGPLPSHSDR